MGKSSYSCLPNVFIRWCFSLVARWFLQILASGVCGLLHRSPCSLTSVPCSEVKCACYALWRIKLIVSNITADLGCGLITGESWASRPKWFKRKRWTEGNEGECQKAHSSLCNWILSCEYLLTWSFPVWETDLIELERRQWNPSTFPGTTDKKLKPLQMYSCPCFVLRVRKRRLQPAAASLLYSRGSQPGVVTLRSTSPHRWHFWLSQLGVGGTPDIQQVKARDAA